MISTCRLTQITSTDSASGAAGTPLYIDVVTNFTPALVQVTGANLSLAGLRVSAASVANAGTFPGTVTVTDGAGRTVAQNLTFTLTSVAAPVNTIAPAITGTATSGSTLTAGQGTWDNVPVSYTRQWFRADPYTDGVGAVYTDANGEAYWAEPVINLGTAETLVLTSSEIGFIIGCNVTATNAAGSATQISNIVGPVT
jgi:hypothetical protein